MHYELTVMAFGVAFDALVIFFIHRAYNAKQKNLRSLIVLAHEQNQIAIAKERERITRDFHDGVGTYLASIVMQCDYLLLAKPNTHVDFASIKECAKEALEDMRRSIACLHEKFFITEAISSMIERIQRVHHLPISTHRLDLLQAICVYHQMDCCRIIQEALTNALKHARATRLCVQVEERKNRVRIIVADDGIGFVAQENLRDHFGLKNIQARAKLMGGHVTITSSKGLGTKVILELEQLSSYDVSSLA